MTGIDDVTNNAFDANELAKKNRIKVWDDFKKESLINALSKYDELIKHNGYALSYLGFNYKNIQIHLVDITNSKDYRSYDNNKLRSMALDNIKEHLPKTFQLYDLDYGLMDLPVEIENKGRVNARYVGKDFISF